MHARVLHRRIGKCRETIAWTEQDPLQSRSTLLPQETEAPHAGRRKGVGMCVGPIFSETPTLLDWLQYYAALGVQAGARHTPPPPPPPPPPPLLPSHEQQPHPCAPDWTPPQLACSMASCLSMTASSGQAQEWPSVPSLAASGGEQQAALQGAVADFLEAWQVA